MGKRFAFVTKDEKMCKFEQILEKKTAEESPEEFFDSEDSNEESCAASECIQPLGDSIKWVQCDGHCNRWFHMFCVGLTKIRKKETYLCNSCRGTGKESPAAVADMSPTEMPERQEAELMDLTNNDESALKPVAAELPLIEQPF